MATYYVSTTGSDSNPGTISQPFLTWEHLASVLVAGDTAYIRGGTYHAGKSAATSIQVHWNNLNGTLGSPILISAYPGESPVMDLSDVLHTATDYYGIYLHNSEYVHCYGLRVTGLAQNSGGPNPGAPVWGWINDTCTNCTIEFCEVDHIGGQGCFDYNSVNTLWKNCDAHHCSDPYSTSPYGGSNGFSATGGGNTSTGIVYDGCRAWFISDDGWDFFGIDGHITIKNCWSFWNGFLPGFTVAGDGQGIKLGPTASSFPATVKRVCHNNLVFENRVNGFDQNGGDCIFNLWNNTSFNNPSNGYFFGYFSNTNSSKNNISFNDGNAYNGAEIAGDHNSWNGGVTLTSGDFLSTSSAGVDGARQSNGDLPVLNFLKLAAGSDLINAGVDVGLPYNVPAPDLGAYEFAGNSAPSANAGSDATITLPTSSITLTGSGLDIDGTIATYAWTQIAGTSVTIVSPSSATTNVTGLTGVGTYTFRLTVTDNLGATATDDVKITVSQNSGVIAKHLLRMGIIANSKLTTSGCVAADPSINLFTYSSVTYNFASEATYTVSMKLNSTGTKMIMGDGSGDLYIYNLGTPYNVSTASFSSSTNFTEISGSITGFTFSADGTKLYMVTNSNNAYQYALSIAYDITSRSYVNSYNFSADVTEPEGIEVSADGTKWLVLDFDDNSVHQYSMTSGAINTSAHVASLDTSAEFGPSDSYGFTVSTCGTAVYVGGSSRIYQYNLLSGYTLSGGSYSGNSLLFSGTFNYTRGMQFLNNTFYLQEQGGKVYQFA